MQKTAEIAACQNGLPAEVYSIPVVGFDGGQATFGFYDLEKIPASIFYRWLNDVARLCDLCTRFIARDDWYSSAADRWSAIQTLATIARMHGLDERQILRWIYTEKRLQKVLGNMPTQKHEAVRDGAVERQSQGGD